MAQISVLNEKKKVPPTSYYLKQRPILINLIIMSLVWLSAAFGYYMLILVTNSFTDPYLSSLASSFADILAYILTGAYAEKVGMKLTINLLFVFAIVGGCLILAWGLQH